MNAINDGITIQGWLEHSAAALAAISDSPRVDAEYLLAAVLRKERSYFFTWPDKRLSAEERGLADRFLARRVKGEPVAHILGERAFWSLDLFCDNSTLIPRADTEALVEGILQLPLPQNARVLDLGTGTGAIALALAGERKGFHIDAVDSSENALRLAEKNRQRHHALNVNIHQSNWFSEVNNHYDVIVSNPPYIDEDDIHLELGDLRFEPRSALVAADQGLADIRKIIASASEYLKPQGFLVLEHGWQQKGAVQLLFTQAGYDDIQSWKDYGGHDRATLGRQGGGSSK